MMSSIETGTGANPGTLENGVPSHASAREASVTAAAHGIGTASGNDARNISSRQFIIEIARSVAAIAAMRFSSPNLFGAASFVGASAASSCRLNSPSSAPSSASFNAACA